MSSNDPCRCDESIEYREALMSVAEWLSSTHAQKSWGDPGARVELVKIQRALRAWWQDGDDPIPSTNER